jgi:hypothetical protein
MDMSFARRNAKWAMPRQPRIKLATLLAESVARQSVTPTAKAQAEAEKNNLFEESVCQVGVFAPARGDRNQRRPASFSLSAASLLTGRQS